MQKHMPLWILTTSLACCTTGAAVNSAPTTPAPVTPLTAATAHGGPSNGTIHWIGGPTAVLERGGLRVITDPMLGPRGENAFTLPKHPSSGVIDAPVARYTSPAPLTIDGLDAILISHTHNDHVDATAKRMLPKSLPLVVAAAGAEAMRAAGFTDVRPLDWGQTLTLEAHGTKLQVLAVPAHHAHAGELDAMLGKGNGYILDWQNANGSYRIYWTGDAVVSDETKDFESHYGKIDLLLPHMGGVGGDGGLGLRTMNSEEAMELVNRVAPTLVIPIHHTTFAHYREPIEALQQRAAEAGQVQRFHFIREGETYKF